MFNVFRKFYDLASTAATVGGIAGGPIGLGVSAGLQAAIGIAQMVKGSRLNKQADEMERNLRRPVYNIQQGIIDNQNLAESRAGQGLSDASLSYYDSQSNKGLTTSIDAILRGGGNVGNIADLYDAQGDNYAKVAMLEEEARLKNLQTYINANERTAGEQDKAWQLNIYNPYMDKVSAIDKVRNRANATRDAGRGMAVGAVNNFVTGNLLRAQTGFGNPDDPTSGGFRPAGNPMYQPTSTVIPPLAQPTIPFNGVQSTPMRGSVNPLNATQYGEYFKRMLNR